MAVNVGIDLGTTNCTIGRIGATGHLRLRGPVPSLGAYRNGEMIWGDEAKRVLLANDAMYTPIRDLKIALTGNEFRVGAETVYTIDMLVSLLNYLVQTLGLHPDDLETAVIGTPVSVNEPRKLRRVVEEGAKEVGFQAVRFVYEPTAALIGAESSLGWLEGRHLILVVDWGGGTLDLAVIRKEDNLYRELAVKANYNDLGGTYMDKELTDRVLEGSPDLKQRVNTTPGHYELLRGHVERHKEIILGDTLRDDNAPELFAPGWLGAAVTLYPAMVNEVITDFAQRAAQKVGTMLNRAGIRSSEITHILFAGGVSQSSIVRETIHAVIPGACVYHDAPQLQTGKGCTLVAKKDYAIELGADFGVRQSDESVCVMLPQGHPVATDSYRKAHFMVTDPSAKEAVLDFGISTSDGDDGNHFARTCGRFQSKKQLWVKAGPPQTAGGSSIPDEIIVHAGVDHYLTVAVNAHSNRGKDSQKGYVSEIPLAIRLNR